MTRQNIVENKFPPPAGEEEEAAEEDVVVADDGVAIAGDFCVIAVVEVVSDEEADDGRDGELVLEGFGVNNDAATDDGCVIGILWGATESAGGGGEECEG